MQIDGANTEHNAGSNSCNTIFEERRNGKNYPFVKVFIISKIMANNEIVFLEVQLDMGNASKDMSKITNQLLGVKYVSTSLTDTLYNMAESLKILANYDLSQITTNLEQISYLVQDIANRFNDSQDGNQWADSLATISNLCTILETLITLEGTLTMAKIASKAEDLAIISLYAVDYVKAFGSMIAKMATSTAAWIANTAAKVGNTAAQWAQIAAVTAWQAICTAATAVTTAFGAAMTFLTSPIGLVVVGITALIAIIVLLIANWDTVSAALVAGWDWLCTKIQAVAAFVQNIFVGVNAFLQGVFAKDWTEQFGAVGNVLNTFFANFENLWNAVKSIFSGVISFVKNVFAGDWIGIWNSLVSVFKGIWDLLVSVVKAPINGIIGLINGLVQGIVDGINLVIGALNGIHFTIPDWIPGLGGMTVGFQLKPLNAPKIPYLARGAVLPANRPFLAVLGDQRHGNNIEAPEGLIRDIFKEEMGDFLGGMLAGFEALLEENRALRAAVECIEVGDTTIGQAANRYNDKMAVVRGRA